MISALFSFIFTHLINSYILASILINDTKKEIVISKINSPKASRKNVQREALYNYIKS